MAEMEVKKGVNGWKANLHQYAWQELRALTFKTDVDLKIGLERVATSELLSGVPRELVGDRTLIIPRKAVQYLADLDFFTSDVALRIGPLEIGKIFETECLRG